jgi:LytS/YehU family sensor histidine kinase
MHGCIAIQHIILFYTGLAIVHSFSSIKKRIILLILVIIISSYLCACTQQALFDFLPNMLLKVNKYKFKIHFAIVLINVDIIIFLIFSYYYINKYLILQEQKRVIEQQQATLNQTILDAELMGLKNQINPHFIYNTLNFMYAQALGSAKELSKSILILSEIMYYNIKEFNDKNHIPLSIEIKHIENIIQLQNIKYHHALNIMLDINGNPEFRRISHLSIAIFIENAIDFVVKRKNSKKILFNINVYEDVLTLYVNFDLKENIPIKEKLHIFQEAQDKLKEIYHNRAYFQFNNTKLDSIQYTITINL